MPIPPNDQSEQAVDKAHARTAILALLDKRSSGSTICPSEVARALAADARRTQWRGAMPTVHAAVDDLLREAAVRLSWKGQSLPQRSGPYRIGAISKSDGD